MNYFAKGNQVFYYESREDCAVVFLTVHPTPSNKTEEDQAVILARMLNDLPVVSK